MIGGRRTLPRACLPDGTTPAVFGPSVTIGERDVPRAGARLWVPYEMRPGPDAGTPTPRDVEPHRLDRYAVVDDIDDGLVVFAVSRWPSLGERGWLDWPEDEREFVVPVVTAQDIIGRARRARGVVAPDRRLRVGDAFLLRAEGRWRPTGDLDSMAMIIDVSAAARERAKVALYSAVAPTIDSSDELSALEYRTADTAHGDFDIRQPDRHRSDGESDRVSS